MKMRELTTMIDEAARVQMDCANRLGGSDNPQVIDMRNRAQTAAATLEAVRLAIRGDRVFLRLLARQ